MFEEDQLKNMWRFGRYAVLYYIPDFLLSSSGRDAAFNDLQLYKALLKYREVDQELADSALDTFNRHLWYLAPQTVLFALFSNRVSDDMKSRMASRLLTLDRKESPTLGVPKFPVSYADYNKVKTFVSTVKVVNDCAERAVALVTDYYKVFVPFFYFMVDYLNDMD